MLGFKRLVLDNKTPLLENLDFRDRPATRRTLGSLMFPGNPLSDAFKAFHGTIESLLDRISFGSQANVAVFSDSLFVASERYGGVLKFAEELLSVCIGFETPLRMGIGYGSFIPYGSASQETPGLKYLSSQFFGTGVIHATTAEDCMTGMRIGLHKTVSDALDALRPSLPTYKRLMLPEPLGKGAVTQEWNYLGNWSSNPYLYGAVDTDADVRENLRMHINRMHERAPKDARIQEHYTETKAAFSRMCDAVDAFLAQRREQFPES